METGEKVKIEADAKQALTAARAKRRTLERLMKCIEA